MAAPPPRPNSPYPPPQSPSPYPPPYPPGYPPPPGAPYPGYPYPVPPAPRKDSSTTIMIIVVILVVVFLLIVPILYLLVTGLVTQPSPPRPFVNLSTGAIGGGNITIHIESDSSAPSLAPQDLTYLVQSANGSIYFSGASGENATTNQVTVSVFYDDVVNVGRVSIEDSIRVQISPPTARNVGAGTLQVIFQGERIGSASLP